MRAMGAALAATALLVTGCSGGTDDDARTAGTSSSSPAVTVTPAAPPTSVDYGPVTLVTGTDTFSLDEGRVRSDPDGTSHGRGGRFWSTLESDDERVSGTHVATWSTDRWGTAYDGALVQWGKSRITNDGGAWVGRYTGVYTPQTHDMMTWWFTGTGGYEGLSMYMWETTSGGFEATFHALVFPGEPPPS
ncbi:hypothetical protein [Nocardioides sediminis]|uniref:hypothetical protein n=1 Tax=Nocardioides sediminis TaxID=433648 RepID=UPI000D309AC4|nr:hypothetical protein [Nocardioides sediminis]